MGTCSNFLDFEFFRIFWIFLDVMVFDGLILGFMFRTLNFFLQMFSRDEILIFYRGKRTGSFSWKSRGR
jgi:hypothetical protein